MSNERFCSVCKKYIKFNNEFNRHLISYDYVHEKKLSHFIFHDTYLKENEIENLQQHVKNKKNKKKVLQSFMNNLKTLKKNI